MIKTIIAGSGDVFQMEGFDEYQYKIAADGGVDFYLHQGQKPDILVGDMDSISDKGLADIKGRTEILRYPPEKDWTDLELAIEKAIQLKSDEITLVGVTGKRMDHTLNNIHLAYGCFKKGIRMQILDENNAMSFIGPGQTSFLLPSPYVYFSLLPWHQDLNVSYIAKAKYEVQNRTFSFGTGLGISNEPIGEEPVSIYINEGEALLVFSREAAQK